MFPEAQFIEEYIKMDRAVPKIILEATFDANIQSKVAIHFTNLETRFFGLTSEEFRRFAFEITQKYKIKHRFDTEKELQEGNR